MNEIKWYKETREEIYNILNSNEHGLTKSEANKRLKKNGLNKLPQGDKNTLLKVFIRQFCDPIIFILLITAFLSFIVGEKIDTLFILIVILSDAILGTFQEWKAEKSAESLKKMIKVKTVVLRNGHEEVIDAEKLVIGDIVKLASGDKVSADLRIIESHNLTIDEAFLTGESLAAVKNDEIIKEDVKVSDQYNMCFAGSTVMTGRATAIVVGTGMNTEIGKIAHNVIFAEETKTPLVLRMESFTKHISYITLVLAVILFIILYNKGYPLEEIFMFVIALSIAAIPEGLPMVLTVVLSIATRRMAKKNVIVRKLNGVESLGSCTVIATDKTGTLTLNEQTAKTIKLPDGSSYKVSGQGYNGEGNIISDNIASKYKDSFSQLSLLNELIFLNNEADLIKEKDKWLSHGDSIDIALLGLSYKIGKINLSVKQKIIGSIPYESQNKYSAVFYNDNNSIKVAVKGSVERVLSSCEFINTIDGKTPINKKDIIKQNDELAKQGYRVIAVAQGEVDQYIEDKTEVPFLTLVGLIGFIDPIREDAAYAIKKCHNAGIKVVMITGDHPLTATTIAKEVGIITSGEKIADGDDIDKYLHLGDNKFDEFVKNTYVFARVTPEQKLAIVESFKRQGEFIAVTGDGVNDAPALKSANIGVAMGSGTSVAKETSTLIIADDKFSSIVNGIEEGRYAYSNIRKVIYLLIACGFAEIMLFIFALLFNTPMPLLAIQLLWLNLVTDGIQDIALAFEGGEKELMNKKPRNPKEKIFNKLLIQETVISGLTISIIVFGFWYILLNYMNLDVDHARSYVLLIMVFMQNVHVFNCRSETESAFKIPIRNNKFVVIGVIATLTLQFIVSKTTIMSDVLNIYPISIQNMLLAISLTIPLLMIMEIFKYFKRKQRK